MTADRVIVLNTDMTILGTTHWKRAIRLIVKGRAETLADSETIVHPSMKIPKVIRLIKAIRSLWRKEVPWSKQNVHIRDLFRCYSCSSRWKKYMGKYRLFLL